MEYSEEVFKKKLVEFFDRHDPEKANIIPDIVEKFSGEQELVFKHLTNLYAEKHGVDDITITNDSIFSVPGSSHSGYAG